MYKLLKSCFGQTDSEYMDYIDYMIKENSNSIYKSEDIDIFYPNDLKYLEFMAECFKNSGQFPSEKYFIKKFPDLSKDISDISDVIPLSDFRVHVNNIVQNNLKKRVSNRLKELVGEIAKGGISQKVDDRYNKLKNLVNKNKAPDIQLRMNMRDIYAERLKKLLGMQTGIKKFDELIGGMDEGTVTTIAGYTSHFKTMFAMNIAYLNAYTNGYNIAYSYFH